MDHIHSRTNTQTKINKHLNTWKQKKEEYDYYKIWNFIFNSYIQILKFAHTHTQAYMYTYC